MRKDIPQIGMIVRHSNLPSLEQSFMEWIATINDALEAQQRQGSYPVVDFFFRPETGSHDIAIIRYTTNTDNPRMGEETKKHLKRLVTQAIAAWQVCTDSEHENSPEGRACDEAHKRSEEMWSYIESLPWVAT